MKVPASFPTITNKDKEALHKAVDKGWFTEGLWCNKFETALSTFTDKKFCQLVNSGSSANLIAVTAAVEKWNSGNLIITSAVGFPTTVAPIYQNDKIPVFVDIDLKTLSPNIGQIAYLIDKYGDDICGGIFGHVLGFPYDERLVKQLFGEERFLIADNCDALGSYVRGRHVGHWADITTYSFFPAHHITTAGEGGAILTDDEEIFKIMRSLVNWGRDCYCMPGQQNVCGKRFDQEFPTLPKGYDHKYTFSRLGYNLKMTELQGAMGVTQLENEFKWRQKRKYNHAVLDLMSVRFSEYIQRVVLHDWSSPSPFGYPIILKVQGYTDDLIRHLEEKGISTRRIFAGNIIRQPGYFRLPNIKLDLDNSNYIMENAFWVGCWPGMTNEQLNWIEAAFTVWFDEKGLL